MKENVNPISIPADEPMPWEIGKHADGTVTFRAKEDWLEPLRRLIEEAQGRALLDPHDGRPSDTYARVARLWSAYLDEEVESHDAAMMMLLVSVARITEQPSERESIIDLIRYALVYADCAGVWEDE